MTTDVASRARVRGIVDSIDESGEDPKIVLRLPATDYRVRLRLAGDATALRDRVGKRVTGTVTGRAQRFHAASGGGCFIEPIAGEPRIVAGKVIAIDEAAQRVLVHVAMPMWLETADGQDLSVFTEGGLVTGYVESGATFEPA